MFLPFFKSSSCEINSSQSKAAGSSKLIFVFLQQEYGWNLYNTNLGEVQILHLEGGLPLFFYNRGLTRTGAAGNANYNHTTLFFQMLLQM